MDAKTEKLSFCHVFIFFWPDNITIQEKQQQQHFIFRLLLKQ